ncbi:MAG: hypothetical protein ACYSUY_14280 [Planctomycetota bacterium]|jgi:hypothetical protein
MLDAGFWIPAFAGMTGILCAVHALPNFSPSAGFRAGFALEKVLRLRQARI